VLYVSPNIEIIL